ncbi:MAG TPA: hypothetical protein VE422_40630 [Terriglobia bacterium]|nr:hypothetical protein [Terriglobia bacterium]
MKKLITFIFALSLVAYLSGMTTYAQGKGHGQGAAVGQNRGQAGKVRSDDRSEHGKSEKTNKDKDESREAKLAKQDEKFEERIERNPAFRSKVESLLPAGMNLRTAANGFKNQGQFIAALHVSRNLNIPFDQLKTQMTGSNPKSLGEAIHQLRPNMTEKQASDAATRAQKQAKATEKTKPIS